MTVLQGLEAAVKKSVSGDVGGLLLNLLVPPHEHDAFRFQQAMAVSTPSASVLGYAYRLSPPRSVCRV